MTITQRDACEDIKGALQRGLCTGAYKSKEQTEHVVHGYRPDTSSSSFINERLMF